LADARGLTVGDGLTASGAVLQYEPDGILSHCEGFSFIFSKRHDFWQRWNAYGKAAFVFGLENDRKCSLLIHRCLSFGRS